MKTKWVLWWRHHDGSGQAIVRVYDTKEDAESDMRLLDIAESSKDFKLEEAEYMSK